MTPLAERSCIPCRGGTPPLTAEQIAPLLAQLDGWMVIDDRRLTKRFQRADFRDSLALINRIGAMAEEQDHHPDLALAWGQVDVTIWTHTIDGLTESDFVFAAKCDALHADGATA